MENVKKTISLLNIVGTLFRKFLKYCHVDYSHYSLLHVNIFQILFALLFVRGAFSGVANG